MSLEESTLEFDETFAGILEDINDQIPTLIRRSEYRQTVRSLLSLAAAAGAIKLAINDLAGSGHIYGTSILLRSLIEHYLRFQFVWFRWIRHQSDEPGEEYVRFSNLSEALEYGEALRLSGILKGYDVHDKDMLELMKERDSTLADLSKNQIQKMTTQWRYRSIIRYVCSMGEKEGQPKLPFLSSLIPVYAELSSYTHGGETAQREAAKLMHEDRAEDVAWEQASWGCVLSNSMHSQLLMTLSATKGSSVADALGKMKVCLQEFLDDSKVALG